MPIHNIPRISASFDEGLLQISQGIDAYFPGFREKQDEMIYRSVVLVPHIQ